MRTIRRINLLMAGVLGASLWTTQSARPAEAAPPAIKKGTPVKVEAPGPPPGTILGPGESPIDLGTALRLAGSENPELLFARARVTEAAAVRQLAAVQLLPNLNLGTNYDLHRGALQQANGNILKVNKDSLYLGLGANAVGAGTVMIPGLNYNLNIGESWFNWQVARQRVASVGATADGVRNDVLLRVCLAYVELLRGEGRQAIAQINRKEAADVARLTADYAATGQGRKADADRAAVELKRRDGELAQAEGDTLAASARLAQLLNLDPASRLRPIDGWVVPAPLVPSPVPLSELLAIALLQRPELASRRADIRAALYSLSLAKVLPFSPNVILGFSAGGFGGGSDLIASDSGFISGNGARIVAPRFTNLRSRMDFDAVAFWTLRNLGFGNVALIRAADSQAKQARFREVETMNLVRAQVAEAHAWTAARFLQIDAGEQALRRSQEAFSQDLERIKGGQGLPLELVDSLRLLGRSRYEYLDWILEYNRSQFQLWVAMGRPPADSLSRPIPTSLVPPPAAPSMPEVSGPVIRLVPAPVNP